jgi:hypothetical protein
MARFTTIFWIGVLVLGFGIFFGMELAGRGVERVNGPMERPVKSTVAAAAAPVSVSASASAAPQVGKNSQTVNGAAAKPKENRHVPPASVVPSASEGHQLNEKDLQRASADSLVNTVGHKTGDLLQIMAHHSINGVVTFFDAIFK